MVGVPRSGRALVPGLAAASLVLILAACLPASVRPTALPSPTSTPTPSATPVPTPTPGPPTPTPGPAFVLHTVVKGDTLTKLARTYETTGRSIAYWNRDEHPSLDPESPDYQPNNLKRGWVLRILPGQEYVPPPDEGETGEKVTPIPDDSEDYETLPPDASESPG